MLLIFIIGRRRLRLQSGGAPLSEPYHRPLMPLVRLYSRRVCGLCDVAREAIEQVRLTAAFAFEEVVVDDDPDLEARFGARVPVLEVDGHEELEYHVDAHSLRALLGTS